jgi:hypothetical protein
MKLLKLLFLVGVLFAFSSCSITEKIVFNEDNSGQLSYVIDGSKMLSMIGSSFKEEDKKAKKKKSKKGDNFSKDIDSTFTFKEIFESKKDSIAKLTPEQQEKIKKMENFSVRMVMNEEKELFNYTLFTDFKNTSEINDIISPLESMKTLNPSGKSLGSKGDMLVDNSSSSFLYDGKVFKKIIVNKAEDNSLKDPEMVQQEEEMMKSLQESMKMIYDESYYKVEYQFPKPIKKVSYPNAVLSDDRKTVTIQFSLKEYAEHPENLSLEVELE